MRHVEEVACRGEWDGWADWEIGRTRLNSSHVEISYAVFCLKKKTSQPSQASHEFGNSSRNPVQIGERLGLGGMMLPQSEGCKQSAAFPAENLGAGDSRRSKPVKDFKR